jgi:hypothetical protein
MDEDLKFEKLKNDFRNIKYLKSKVDLNKNEQYREIIDKKFNDPSKYLEYDDKVIIGKYLFI